MSRVRPIRAAVLDELGRMGAPTDVEYPEVAPAEFKFSFVPPSAPWAVARYLQIYRELQCTLSDLSWLVAAYDGRIDAADVDSFVAGAVKRALAVAKSQIAALAAERGNAVL